MVFWLKINKFLKLAAFAISFCAITMEVYAKKSTKNSYLNENFTVNIRRDNDHLIAKFKDWSIYKIEKDGKKYCYAMSLPIEKKGRYFKRAQSYFLVSDLIDDADEIAVISGFYFKENSDVEISFGLRKFYLFAHDSRAFAYSANDDLDIIKAMQQNAEFTITAFARDNKIIKDRYSLIGFRQAYFKLKETCKNE